jgi:TolB-like protein/class 3 adenylate cyclase
MAEPSPETAAQIEHRTAVVLCADVVGYSRLMGIDEEGTFAVLNAIRREIVYPRIDQFNGVLVRRMGDGLLIEFASVFDAVAFAIAFQQEMRASQFHTRPEGQIRFRIGITVDDVVDDGKGIYGDAVKIAARLESLAQPGGINVSGAVLDQIGDRLAGTLTDLGEHQAANVARPVRVFRIASDEHGNPSRSADQQASTIPSERPAVAVLPFQNLGGDTETEFFLNSVAEDLITELSRARWFAVVARNTAFSYKGADAKQLHRELGVDYVLEGSLRQAGDRVRIGCQLVDTANGQHLWAERFDGTMTDSFDLQDKITESVIGSVGPVLRASEIERARNKPETEQNVYNLTLCAIVPAFTETAEENERALRLLNRAQQFQSSYATTNAVSAWCYLQRHLMAWPGGQNDDRETAKRLARMVMSNAADLPLELALAGAVRAALTRDHAAALAAADRAIIICNNSALVLGFDALTRCICAAYDKAIEHAEKAIRLSPLEPLRFYAEFALSLAFLLTDRSDEAVASALKSLEGNQNFAFAHCVLALGLVRLGRQDEAVMAVRRLLKVAPNFSIGTLRKIRFAGEQQMRANLESLRRLGIPG